MARDYAALITSEHRDRPKFAQMVGDVTLAWGDITDFLRTVPAAFDVDTAVGAQLDIIGLWVGQPRLIPSVLLVGFFGFDDNPAALPYGEEGDLSVGGRFYGEGEDFTASTIPADPEYRTLILARIARDMAKGTTDEIVGVLSFVFSAPATIDDPGDMTIGIAIGRLLTLTERAIISGLDILPRPAGVRISRRVMYDASRYFGFSDQINALPLGEEGSPAVGGPLAEEF